jgi:hypothetical protein
MTLNIDSYPLQASEIKLTSSHGDLFAKGLIDLFSGYIEMSGTFLKPAAPDKPQEDPAQKETTAFTLAISGLLNAPELSETSIIDSKSTPEPQTDSKSVAP